MKLYEQFSNLPVDIQAIHGFAGDGEDFSLVRAHSKNRWSTVDLLGHGHSDSPQNEKFYTLKYQLELFHKYARGKILLGYSMGARFAMHAFLQKLYAWEGLILISGTPGIEEGREERQKWEDKVIEILKSSNSGFWDYWSKLPILQSQNRGDEVFLQQREERRKRMQSYALIGAMKGLGTGRVPSLWGCLEGVSRPVLLIVGEEDRKYRLIADRMMMHLKEATLYVVEGAGHAPHIERPASCAERIDAWFVHNFS